MPPGATLSISGPRSCLTFQIGEHEAEIRSPMIAGYEDLRILLAFVTVVNPIIRVLKCDQRPHVQLLPHARFSAIIPAERPLIGGRARLSVVPLWATVFDFESRLIRRAKRRYQTAIDY